MKVLIVDDDEGSRKLLCDLLGLKNVVCVEADNGTQALALISSEIGLCITDIKLPDIDGYEVASQVKKKYPEIPIIVCTASIPEVERIKMMHMNLFSAVLLKPVHLKNFNEVVGKFLPDT